MSVDLVAAKKARVAELATHGAESVLAKFEAHKADKLAQERKAIITPERMADRLKPERQREAAPPRPAPKKDRGYEPGF